MSLHKISLRQAHKIAQKLKMLYRTQQEQITSHFSLYSCLENKYNIIANNIEQERSKVQEIQYTIDALYEIKYKIGRANSIRNEIGDFSINDLITIRKRLQEQHYFISDCIGRFGTPPDLDAILLRSDNQVASPVHGNDYITVNNIDAGLHEEWLNKSCEIRNSIEEIDDKLLLKNQSMTIEINDEMYNFLVDNKIRVVER